MIVWHYTTGLNMVGILDDMCLHPEHRQLGKGERGAVWFSSREDWEPTATKALGEKASGMAVQMDLERMERMCRGLFRIGVDRDKTAPISWARWKRLSGCPALLASCLEQVGREQGGNPVDWWCTFKPVPVEAWRLTEMRAPDGDWVPWVPEEFLDVPSSGR